MKKWDLFCSFSNTLKCCFVMKSQRLLFLKNPIYHLQNTRCSIFTQQFARDQQSLEAWMVRIELSRRCRFFLLHIFQWSVMQKTASFLLASYKSFSLVCSLLYGRNIRYYFSPFGHCSKTFKVRSLVHALLKGSKLFTKVGCMMLHSRAVFSLFSFLFWKIR